MQNRLNAKFVRSVSEPGRYCDGNCLHLVVHPAGTKNWVVRTMVRRRRRDIGIGGFPMVSLSEARLMRDSIVKEARMGGDPLLARRRAKELPTFAEAAYRVIEERRPTWRSDKQVEIWRNSLKAYCFPVFGDEPVDSISPAMVRRSLEPIWTSKHDTATKVLQRVQIVFKWAIGNGYRSAANPCEGLRETLPRVAVRTKHLSALPWQEVPALISDLRDDSSISALALQFIILTACRTNEVRRGGWSEIEDKQWRIPGERMKMGREHVVPLTPQMSAVLEKARGLDAKLLFPGQKRGALLSDMTILKRLRHHRPGDFTVHGFRSAFRDWADEYHKGDGTVAEACLAHRKGDAIVQAYARSTLLERRRELMETWSNFVEPLGATIGFP
ncbi:MAG: integrase arm-type DNA-binding domain-containing protein [Pseudomonadota bacterium]